VCAKPFNAEKLLELVERLAAQYQLAPLDLKSEVVVAAAVTTVVANSDAAAGPNHASTLAHILIEADQ
jgi:hypothetical protein